MKELVRLYIGRKLLVTALVTCTGLVAVAATTSTGAMAQSTVKDTCGYDPNNAPKPGGGTVQFEENNVTRAIAFYGVGTSGHLGVFTNDETGLLIGQGGTPSSSVGSKIGTLKGAIGHGASVSSISVASPGLTIAISAGDSIVLGNHPNEAFTADAAAAAGATNISVTTKTATATFSAGARIADSTLIYGQAVPPTLGSGVDHEGRALAPQIYLTDITNNPSANGGDYEQGGSAANAGHPPFADAIYGSWSPTVGKSPVNKNHWDLGPNADPVPASAIVGHKEQGYGAEVVWNVARLKAWDSSANGGAGGYVALQPGHTYRAQSLTHDADQNHTTHGGDVGEVCTTFHIPTPQLLLSKSADHSLPVNAGSQIGFTVEVKNTGDGDATSTALSDPLPAGSGSGVTWTIDPTVGTPTQFVLSGAKGHQKLGLASSRLPAGADYKVHIVAQTSETECSTYSNTATLTAGNAKSPNPVSTSESCAYRVDLSVTKSGAPNPLTLGRGNITWTIAVTNHGPDTDTGVTIADPMPSGNTFVSATTAQGTCTGGAIFNCNIGTIAAGSSVTVTLVTRPSKTGIQTNTVTVAGARPETNTADNTATATVLVVGTAKPPVYCIAVSRVTPKQLFVGRKMMLTIHVTLHNAAVKGVHVRIRGPKIDVRTGASNDHGVIKRRVKMKNAGILIITPIASRRCNTKRVGVTGVPTPPVTG